MRSRWPEAALTGEVQLGRLITPPPSLRRCFGLKFLKPMAPGIAAAGRRRRGCVLLNALRVPAKFRRRQDRDPWQASTETNCMLIPVNTHVSKKSFRKRGFVLRVSKKENLVSSILWAARHCTKLAFRKADQQRKKLATSRFDPTAHAAVVVAACRPPSRCSDSRATSTTSFAVREARWLLGGDTKK